MCACACVCVCARVRVCLQMCVRAGVCMCDMSVSGGRGAHGLVSEKI